jgi:hypothetical protein
MFLTVIPGHREAMGPESMLPVVVMGSGLAFASLRRPG